MNPSIIYANTTIATKEKIKFDKTTERRMFSAQTKDDAAKLLIPFGYDIEHEDHIATKKLAEILKTFYELCPDENLKNFVLAAADIKKEGRETELEKLRTKLKNLSPQSLTYIENFFTKGVTGLPQIPTATAFDLEMFVGWFIMKLEELRTVKAILIAKKLGISQKQFHAMMHGDEAESITTARGEK